MKKGFAARRTGGLTLVELLVAMTLVATLTAGGLAAYARANTTWRAQQADQRRYERAQYVFGTLEPDLQMAGYFGRARPASLPPSDVPQSLRACGADSIASLELPLQRFNSLPATCVARIAQVPGSDALLVRRVSSRVTAPRPGHGQWVTSTDSTIAGAIIWDGQLPAAIPNPEIRDLVVRLYYVARSADGDTTAPALRVKTLTEIAGTPALVDTEVMPGVESLQVDMSPEAAPRSVRISLRVRADARDVDAPDAGRKLSITRHFTLRNTATDAT